MKWWAISVRISVIPISHIYIYVCVCVHSALSDSFALGMR